MKNNLDIVKEWVRKAEIDLSVATHALKTMEPPPTEAICFHAQQCGEKYLKAFLEHSGISFPYTHYLENLAALCATADKEFENLIPEVKILTPYSVETRYPGDFVKIPVEDAEEAVRIAQKVKEFVVEKLPEL